MPIIILAFFFLSPHLAHAKGRSWTDAQLLAEHDFAIEGEVLTLTKDGKWKDRFPGEVDSRNAETDFWCGEIKIDKVLKGQSFFEGDRTKICYGYSEEIGFRCPPQATLQGILTGRFFGMARTGPDRKPILVLHEPRRILSSTSLAPSEVSCMFAEVDCKNVDCAPISHRRKQKYLIKCTEDEDFKKAGRTDLGRCVCTPTTGDLALFSPDMPNLPTNEELSDKMKPDPSKVDCWKKGSSENPDYGVEIKSPEGYWIIAQSHGLRTFTLTREEFKEGSVQWYPKDSSNLAPRPISNLRYVPAIAGNVSFKKIKDLKNVAGRSDLVVVKVRNIVLENGIKVESFPDIKVTCSYPPNP